MKESTVMFQHDMVVLILNDLLSKVYFDSKTKSVSLFTKVLFDLEILLIKKLWNFAFHSQVVSCLALKCNFVVLVCYTICWIFLGYLMGEKLQVVLAEFSTLS